MSRKARRPTRKSETAELEERWRENTSASMFGHDALPDLVGLFTHCLSPLKADGSSDMVHDLYLIGLVTNEPRYIDAANLLMEMGLGGKDWREKLRKTRRGGLQPFHSLRHEALIAEIKTGATERQAAERVAATWGGGASFESAAKVVRNTLRKPPPKIGK